MNRTLRTIALAAPLATVALGLGATTAHAAQPVGPQVDTISSKPIIIDPAPHGPSDKLAPVDPGDPEPDPEPGPGDGPGDLTGPKPCLHQCGHDGDDDKPGDKGHDDPNGTDIPRPTRVDAGIGSSDDGLELGWVLAGGALVTASGAAYAVRRRARTNA